VSQRQWGSRCAGWLVHPKLASFATGLRRDRAAVDAGLTLEWSQGHVEGQVNRVKVLKRVGYGRCGFDLLKQRVLHTS